MSYVQYTNPSNQVIWQLNENNGFVVQQADLMATGSVGFTYATPATPASNQFSMYSPDGASVSFYGPSGGGANLIVNGEATIDSYLYAQDGATVTGPLVVSGASTLEGAVDAQAGLTVSGGLSADTLSVSSFSPPSVSTGSLSASSATVSGSTSLSSLSVSGSSTLAGVSASSVTASGSLSGGSLSASGTLSVSGSTSLAATASTSLTATSLSVSGSTSLGALSTSGVTSSGDIEVSSAGKGLQIKEGSNARMGIATLDGGTVTVYNTTVTTATRIFLTPQNASGILGSIHVSALTPGTSFVISSSALLDNSEVAYLLIESE